jgi:hypothetical protein
MNSLTTVNEFTFYLSPEETAEYSRGNQVLAEGAV